MSKHWRKSAANGIPSRQVKSATNGLPSRQVNSATNGLPSRQVKSATNGLPSRQVNSATNGLPSRQEKSATTKDFLSYWRHSKTLRHTNITILYFVLIYQLFIWKKTEFRILWKYRWNLIFQIRTGAFSSGGYKEMSSIFADQWRPRDTSPNAGGGRELRGLSQWEQPK